MKLDRRLLVTALVCLVCSAVLVVLASTDVASFSILHDVLAAVSGIERKLYRILGTAAGQYRTSGTVAPLLLLYGVSFLYGVFHAVGPGHGKMVISSFLLTSGGQFRRGIALSFAASIVQAVSAIALVGIFAAVLNLSRFEITHRAFLLEEASYAGIILLGAWMFASRLVPGRAGHDHHGHAHHVDPAALGRFRGAAARRWPGYAAVVVATGIRPCTGAVLVLLFTLAQGSFAVGIVATFLMALGTGLTIAALAGLALLSRHAAMRIAGSDSALLSRINASLGILSSLAIIAAGLLFLLTTISDPPSL